MSGDKALILGLAGCGTVGSGLLRILAENRAELAARTGRDIRVKRILVRDAMKPRAWPLPEGASLTTRMDDLLDDPEIDVAVELMGGVRTAGEFIERALVLGKHVVTANKALLAETGNRLFALARKNNLYLGYEAAVCGAIPVVQTLRECLAANRLESLEGILNGTSNYILSEMGAKSVDFAEALKEAQDLGYAEADPTLDIGGFDAAHKLVLLIRLAFGVEYPYAALPVRGIQGVEQEDILSARAFGYRSKLLGLARRVGTSLEKGGRIEASVSPALVHETFLLARVGGAYNAVRIEGNAIGSVFLHGKGAGDLPTGSAVMADILAIARGARPNNTGFAMPPLPEPARVVPPEEARSPYYIRLRVSDAPGVLRDVAGSLAANDVSIAQVIQRDQRSLIEQPKEGAVRQPGVYIVALTHEAPTIAVKKALDSMVARKLLHEPPVHFPVLVKHG
jgi:homoserine dehydrogenase